MSDKPEMTYDERQELYSKNHPMHGRWNKNHEGHDWEERALHRGAGVTLMQCRRCGAVMKTDGTTRTCVEEVK